MEFLEYTFTIKAESINIEELSETHKQELENNLEKLNLVHIQGNSYGKHFFEQLSNVIKPANNLAVANYSDIFVGRKQDSIPESLGFLADSLIGKNLRSVDISNNAVNQYGAKTFSKFLVQATTLKTFLINNCGLGPEGVETIALSLKEGAKNLEVLAIARNRAEDKGAKAVGLAVGSMQNFKELHISQDVIRKDGMVVLLQSLQNCPNLKVLDIRDNFLNQEAATEMGKLIKGSDQLKSLNLSDCNMEKNDNMAILEALENTNALFEKLGYNYNSLKGDIANKFLEALLSKSATTLKRFDIKGNEFKDSNIEFYEQKFEELGLKNVLSNFESDDEDEETELTKNFNELKL